MSLQLQGGGWGAVCNTNSQPPPLPGPGQNIYPTLGPGQNIYPLPPPPDQVRTSTPFPPGPGQNIYPLPPREYRQVGGTHPTRMHSCLVYADPSLPYLGRGQTPNQDRQSRGGRYASYWMHTCYLLLWCARHRN